MQKFAFIFALALKTTDLNHFHANIVRMQNILRLWNPKNLYFKIHNVVSKLLFFSFSFSCEWSFPLLLQQCNDEQIFFSLHFNKEKPKPMLIKILINLKTNDFCCLMSFPTFNFFNITRIEIFQSIIIKKEFQLKKWLPWIYLN